MLRNEPLVYVIGILLGLLIAMLSVGLAFVLDVWYFSPTGFLGGIIIGFCTVRLTNMRRRYNRITAIRDNEWDVE